MKNVQEVMLSGPPMYRVRLQSAPQRRGFGLRLVSGMENVKDIKPGSWLSQFEVDTEGYIDFNFELTEFPVFFHEESKAKKVSEALKHSADVETQVVVVKVGL